MFTRWQARVLYRTEQGPLEVIHDLLELHELHSLVEHGPHWDTIIRVEITRSADADRTLTVEQALRA